jgi:hypothetical protein
MIALTRRDFLQSAFASSLLVATQKIENARWLLSTRDQIKIGIAGFSGQVCDHLRILASIPTVRIVTLCDQDSHRLQKAAAFLRSQDIRRLRLTMHLPELLADPAVDAISLGSSFPSSFAPLPRLLAAKKPILFDSPVTSSLEEAFAVNQRIVKAGTILRSRLADRLPPEAQNVRALVRAIGTPLEASLASPPFRGGSLDSCLPSLACLEMLFTLSVWPHDSPLLPRDKFLSNAHFSRTGSSALVEFQARDSLLRRARFDAHALTAARQASLSLRGQTGQLTFYAGTNAHPDTAACTIIDFLTAIRFPSRSASDSAQRAFLTAGLFQLIHSQEKRKHIAHRTSLVDTGLPET